MNIVQNQDVAIDTRNFNSVSGNDVDAFRTRNIFSISIYEFSLTKTGYPEEGKSV